MRNITKKAAIIATVLTSVTHAAGQKETNYEFRYCNANIALGILSNGGKPKNNKKILRRYEGALSEILNYQPTLDIVSEAYNNDEKRYGNIAELSPAFDPTTRDYSCFNRSVMLAMIFSGTFWIKKSRY